VDTDWQADPQRFRRKYGLSGPFILYAGRKDAGKNVPLLCAYFLRYLADTGGAGGLKLVMIGNLPAPIPPGGEEHIIDLGFVPLQDKYDAYAAAELLVQPSLMESFSLVIMESWLAGRPVMVHSGCAVTRDHVEASGGGLHFADYPHFAEGLNLLLARPELCRRMGEAGRRYVLDNYSWPVVTRRYRELIQRLWDEPLPRPRTKLDVLRLAGDGRCGRYTNCWWTSPTATPSATTCWPSRRLCAPGAIPPRCSPPTYTPACAAAPDPGRTSPAGCLPRTWSYSTSPSATP
jgi:hypothetical protein